MFWSIVRSLDAGRLIDTSSKYRPRDASTQIVDLPVELAAQVLSNLTFTDLLSLRASSRSYNILVLQDEILLPWVRQNLWHVQIRLSPLPCQHLWQYLLEQGRCWSIAYNTSTVMMDYIDRKVLLHLFLKTRLTVLPTTGYRAAQHNLKNPGVLAHLKEELATRLLLLSHYLRNCKTQLLVRVHGTSQSEDWDYLDSSTFEACVCSPQVYAAFSNKELQDVHLLWLFVVDTLKILTQRPDYMGALEVMFRGLNEKPLDANTLALGLVAGGCSAIKKIFTLRNFCTRKRHIEASLSGFPTSIRDRLTRNAMVSSEARISRSLLDGLWVDGMLGSLMVRGLTVEDQVVMSTSRLTIQLLRELAGFDVFASDEIVEPVMHTDMFGMPR